MKTPSIMEIMALHAALQAGRRTGLLDALLPGPNTAAALATTLGLHRPGVQRVLDVLASRHVVLNDAGTYRLPEALASELVGPSSLLELDARVWAQVEPFVRDGATVETSGDKSRGATYADVVKPLGKLFQEPARRFGEALARELPAGAQILDVGAGSGNWSLALLAAHPDACVTALDLPEVLPRFREVAIQRGLGERVDGIAGDYFTATTTPQTIDLVVFANVLHLEASARARTLLERFVPALKAGGRIAVIDALPEREADPAYAAYALHLGVRLPGAFPHPAEEISGWMKDAGLGRIRRIPLWHEGNILAALVGQLAASPASSPASG